MPASGAGSRFELSFDAGIESLTVVGRALHPAFAEAVPYAPTVVEMEEGVRLLSRVEGVAPDALEIGLPVQVDFDPVTDEISLPIFRPAPD